MTKANFFRDVTLPALGYTATIRKVDAAAISERVTLEVFTSGEGVELSEDATDHFQRLAQSKNLTPDLLGKVFAASEQINRQLVFESVVDLPALLTAYRATGQERDYGMGPDYAALLAEIRAHNGIEDVPTQISLQGLAAALPQAKAPPKSKAKRR